MTKELAVVSASCGRWHLSVAGVVVAMEGDRCRDGNLPEAAYSEIPEEELARASIGGRPASELPIDVVRMVRGDFWNESLLRAAAAKINGVAHDR